MQNLDWEKALNIKDIAAIRLNLALAYRDGSKFDLAKASLEKTDKLRPPFSQANFELAQLYIKENKKQKNILKMWSYILRAVIFQSNRRNILKI